MITLVSCQIELFIAGINDVNLEPGKKGLLIPATCRSGCGPAEKGEMSRLILFRNYLIEDIVKKWWGEGPGHHLENESVRSVRLNARSVETGTWTVVVPVRAGATEGDDPGVSPDSTGRLLSYEGDVPAVKMGVYRTTAGLDAVLV